MPIEASTSSVTPWMPNGCSSTLWMPRAEEERELRVGQVRDEHAELVAAQAR